MSREEELQNSNWLRVLLSAFFSRMRLVLVASLLCAVAAGLSTFLLPKVYTGGFSILIKAPEIDHSTLGENADITVRPGSVEGNIISDEFHILRSDGLAGAVAERYGLDTKLPMGYLKSALPEWLTNHQNKKRPTDLNKKENLANYFKESLVVTPRLKSDIIEITMKSHDKAYLEKLLNLYASEYLNYRRTIWFNQDAQSFFGDQADKSLHEWKNLTDELQAITSGGHRIDPVIEKSELESRISRDLARIQSLQTQVDQYSSQLRTLKEMDPEQAITFFNEKTRENRLFWQLKIDIGEAKARKQELLKDHLPSSPLVKKSDFLLAGLYVEYKLLVTSLIENSLTMIQTERDALIKSNVRNSARIMELNKSNQTISVLKKRIKMFERQYEVYENKAMSIEVQKQSRNALGTAVRIVSPPLVRSAPIWPNRTTLVVVAAILGFFLTLIVVVSLWVMKDSFHFPEDVTGYLGLPVLTTFSLEASAVRVEQTEAKTHPLIPEIPDDAEPTSRRRYSSYAALAFLGMVVAGWTIGTTLWPVWQKHNLAVADEYFPTMIAKAEYQSTPESMIDAPIITTGVDLLAVEEKTAEPGKKEAATVAQVENSAKADMSPDGPVISREQPLEPLPSLVMNAKDSGSENMDTSPMPEQVAAEMEDNAETASLVQGVETEPTPDSATLTPEKETTASQETDWSVQAGTGQPEAEKSDIMLAIDQLAGKKKTDQERSEEKEPLPATPHHDFFLQFGAFSEEKRAKKLQRKLASQGFEMSVVSIPNAKTGATLFKVRAGFNGLKEASVARDRYQAQSGTRPMLGETN